ncbi:hypothetical protein Cni_G19657 [Canna indica]|uniref:Zinc-finger domain-containing protein n=1 Tax=Canna indica TaxID=4628 RepID=A0AAQ3KPW4_9LILI|nr:hypothetical protein Cni_G19657 [Canna indica]
MVTTRGMMSVAAPEEVPETHQMRNAKRKELLRSTTPPPPQQPPPPSSAPATPVDYEKLRDERIKENMERLQKLGVLNLSLQLKSHIQAPLSTPSYQHRRKDTTIGTIRNHKPPSLPLPPSRRSARLQNITPVSYSEIRTTRDVDSRKNISVLIEEGAREEVYTDEHEKLLGTCEMSWTLFVDGYDKDGKRIYDPIKGKTCHQCRQKTLGHRTHCSKCKLLQGQFCGDCLFMRYGENVLETNQNPAWVCPVCRGICNCSFCRTKKGWVPTGCLYKKVVNMGYKSVAHYIIQTRKQNTSSGNLNSSELVSSNKPENCIEDDIKNELNGNMEVRSKVDKENESPTDVISIPDTEVYCSDDDGAENAVREVQTELKSNITKENEAPVDVKSISQSDSSVASRLKKKHRV